MDRENTGELCSIVGAFSDANGREGAFPFGGFFFIDKEYRITGSLVDKFGISEIDGEMVPPCERDLQSGLSFIKKYNKNIITDSGFYYEFTYHEGLWVGEWKALSGYEGGKGSSFALVMPTGINNLKIPGPLKITSWNREEMIKKGVEILRAKGFIG